MNLYQGSESEYEENFDIDDDDDRETLAPGRQCLGITRNYVPAWQAIDAFREFYQNWMDGMLESFHVTRDQVTITIRDTAKEYIAIASTKDASIMGYIRYLDNKGQLELTNFKAKLQRNHLGFGVSSKRGQRGSATHLAGTHGEGFKVGALVMVRKGYQVRYESSSYYWKFSLEGKVTESLYCRTTPMKEEKANRLKTDYKGKVGPGLLARDSWLKGNIWEDTTVRIGKVYGKKTSGKRVEDWIFRDWIKVALALDQPSNIFNTPFGDLILDDEYAGRVYLKGLRLSEEELFHFAYNLAQGTVNRDRERLIATDEEARNLAKIWGFAIKTNKDMVLPKYVQMLREESKKPCADIAGAKNLIDEETTKLIWQYLRESEGKETFFHEKKQDSKHAQIIKIGLKKNPLALPETLWGTLRRWNLVRKPKEEQAFILQNALETQVQLDLYSMGMDRALKAALALDSRTRSLKVVFKAGAEAGMDLLLQKTDKSILIHEKWLDFKLSHRNTPCFFSEKSDSLTHFDCDHIILELYEMILAELRGAGNDDDVKSRNRDAILRQRVNDNFRQMARNVQFDQVLKTGKLTVCWTDTQSQVAYDLHELKLIHEVVLHRMSTCDSMQQCLLNTKGMDDQHYDKEQVGEYDFHAWTAECGCPAQALDRKLQQATFSNLDPNEAYFPMVVAAEPQSFYGVPPEAVKPIKPVEILKSQDVDAHSPVISPSFQQLSSRPRISYPSVDLDDSDSEDTFHSPGNDPLGKTNNDQSGGASENQGGNHETNPTSTHRPALSVLQNTNNLRSKLTEAEDQLEEALRLNAEHLRKIDQINKEREYVESRLQNTKKENEKREKRDQSTIEDLRGENERRLEMDVENSARISEQKSEINVLQTEMEKLQSATQSPQTPPDSGSAASRDAESPPVEEIPSQIGRAREMVDILRSAITIIRSAMLLPSKSTMVITLNAGLGMLDGLLEAEDENTLINTPEKRKRGGNETFKSSSSPEKKPRWCR